MLYVKELYKSYETGKNKYEVLKGIDFHVPQGEPDGPMTATNSP